ncbi:LIM domain-binding protein 2-like isoform X1 [Hydractinia symbiolongicarpus]|uniref:LIM domain-binding protein 2-like isoform X1 n=1 Tax=Hydractinia symbiolongicarpus TaxID=13093 RepID=UPI00255045A8|nr:LIM domain-binding protein 2-like isoform X1 [Hydractinia symbiolongicarpus]
MQRIGNMPTALQNHRRSNPYCLQPDYKIHEFNKRLQQHTEKAEQVWWDELINEYFEDDATLTIQYKDGSHQRRYTVHRRLIPRYFRSLYTGGVSKVYFLVFDSKENYMNTTVTLDCKQASMVTHYTKPTDTKVHTNGHLSIEFSFDDFMRIRNWKFQIKENAELIPKSALLECKGDQTKLDALSNNITESGLSSATLEYLRMGVILEPMQELMSRHKSSGISPKDALKTVLYEKWQAHLMTQDYEQRARMWSNRGRGQAPKKRKPRKTPSLSDTKPTKKKSPSTSSFPPSTTSDVMLVDEPMLMGGKFGDEDERVITRLSLNGRLENTRFTGNNGTTTEDGDDAFASNGSNEQPVSNSTLPWKSDKPPAKDDQK